jgi:23S rRNA pseudouridine1911/1915/1917 synthase
VILACAFEDDWLVVVDKPAGLASHAAQGAGETDLMTLAGARWPGVTALHRLDREASGLMLLCKRDEARAPLQAQLERHGIERVYVAIMAGRLAAACTVDRAVPERAQGRGALRRPPPRDAKPARTVFTPVRVLRGATLVEARLETGRKHQIRVHAASIGHALLGDRRYGGPEASRLALHAVQLSFTHPRDGRSMRIEAPLPPDLRALVDSLAAP